MLAGRRAWWPQSEQVLRGEAVEDQERALAVRQVRQGAQAVRWTARDIRALGVKVPPRQRSRLRLKPRRPRVPRVLQHDFADDLAGQCRLYHFPPFEREYPHPDPTRNWRLDLAWPALRLIVEVDGGTRWGRSTHSKGSGYENDRIRDASAARLGWTTLRYTSAMVQDGRAIQDLRLHFGL